jgi:hypothetical protein
MKTITIRGREFTVEPKTSDRDGARYFVLRGKRGAHYFTMTNVHSGLHFVCNAHPFKPMPFEGVWLKDNDGTLEVVSQ